MKLELSNCRPVNYLWKYLLKRFEVEKAHQLISQALDLQRMRGNKDTLPVLFIQTGGIALTTYKFLKNETGFTIYGEKLVLLFSPKKKSFQLINELKP